MQPEHTRLTPPRPIPAKPRISEETLHQYLDWIASHAHQKDELAKHLAVAELAVRVQGNRAQAKATQHTLVEDGIIKPPPAAS